MFFSFICSPARPARIHSSDLDDMRRAILDEDEDCDGPDGGSADILAFRTRGSAGVLAGPLDRI